MQFVCNDERMLRAEVLSQVLLSMLHQTRKDHKKELPTIKGANNFLLSKTDSVHFNYLLIG